jgi:hypothetical protein
MKGPTYERHSSEVRNLLPTMRSQSDGNDGSGRLPNFLRLHGVRCCIEAVGRELLWVLVLQYCSVSTDPGRRRMLRLKYPKVAVCSNVLNIAPIMMGAAYRG